MDREPRRERGFYFALSTTEEPIMPTLTTTEHGEIHVPHHQVTRMADRLWRLGSPARQTAYVERPAGGSLRGQRVVLMRPSCSRPVTRGPPCNAGVRRSRVIYVSLSLGS